MIATDLHPDTSAGTDRPAPALSVVVPSVNGFDDLEGCLAALEAQEGVEIEVVVPERCGEDVRAAIRERFTHVHVLPVAPSTTIPQMRALAFDAVSGAAVAVIEDHVLVPPGWARQMLTALGEGDRVVAGAVENRATGSLVDWAAFLCEYSHCLPPLPAGESTWLTGNNVVYPRRILQAHRAVTHAGRWEDYLHDTLRSKGVPLVCHPEILVGHRKHYTFGEYLSQRYLYARSYAAARVAGAPAGRRIAYGVTAFGLPPLLLARTVSRILAKGRHQALLVRSLPLITVFVMAWTWGEVVGYWRGAGDSLSRVC